MAKEKCTVRVLNPKTIVKMEEDSILEMELSQIKGVDDTVRDNAVLAKVLHCQSERLLPMGIKEPYQI